MNLNQTAYAVILALAAGISTGIGGLAVLFFKKTNMKILSVMLGFSAGIMIYISFIEIYQEAQTNLCGVHGIKNGRILTVLAFFFGMVLMAFINEFIPESNQPHRIRGKAQDQKPSGHLFRTGLFTAIAVTIHNFPEGIATFISGMKNPALGFSVALAIAIHNIPEGISVSIPIYYATKSKGKAFFISLASGLSEPLGAILAMLILGPFITDTVFGLIFGAVAGIMVYISLDELLPTAREYGEHNLSILGLILGMAVMAVSSVFVFI
ncbi:MAG TPA: zinc transporter ZupT [Ruminiclostridium sp.]|nr:zinc transporter ZupT [Ruminiclostridium sp.]